MSKRMSAILLSAIALLVNGLPDSAIALSGSPSSLIQPRAKKGWTFNGASEKLFSQAGIQVKQDGSRADQIYEQGRQAYRVDNLREALRLYQQALSLYDQADNQTKQSLVLSNMSVAAYNLSEYDRALNYAVQALSAAEEAQEPNMQSLALYALGNAYQALGEDREAVRVHTQGLEIAREISHTRRVSLASEAIADIYTELSEYDKAKENYQISLDAARQVGDKELEGRIILSLGLLSEVQGNSQEAFDLYQGSLQIAREIEDDHIESIALYYLASIFMKNGYTAEAIEYAQQSLEISQNIQNWDFYSSALSLVRYLRGSSNDLQRTTEDIQEILRVARENNDSSSEIWALIALGDQHLELNEHNESLLAYEEGLAIAQSSGDYTATRKLYSSVGFLMETQGKTSAAIAFYKKNINITQIARRDIQNLSTEIQKTYAELNSFAYRQLIDLLLEQGRVLEAQQVLELLKVQELIEYTNDERAGESFSELILLPKEQDIIREFDTLISFGQQLRECEAISCSNLSILQDTRDNQFEQYQESINSLQTFIADRLEEGDDFKLILDPSDFEIKAQEIIGQQPGTVIIYPLVLEDRLWLLWAAEGRVISRREVAVDRLTVGRTVVQFRELLEDRYSDPDDIKSVGKQLYNWLIFPIEDELAANQDINHLVFSLDRTTRYIPLGALHNGEQYLVEKYTISTILSAALTDVSSRSPIGTEGVSILGAGVSESFENFRALSYVPVELDGIIRDEEDPNDTQGSYSGKQLLDPDFTFESLRGALAGRQFLHIATHGNFVSGDRDESYLLMGGGKKLLIPEIETLKTYMEDLHLVVLSACQTALGGPDEEGLEIAGLGYYFLKSQVDAVMASLWNVSDSSTSQFMQTFYEILASGTEEGPVTKAEALQRTQIAMLRSREPGTEDDDRFTYIPQDDDAPLPESGLAHPYYWAPFTLIGNGL